MIPVEPFFYLFWQNVSVCDCISKTQNSNKIRFVALDPTTSKVKEICTYGHLSQTILKAEAGSMRGNFVVLYPNFCDLVLILQVEKYSLSCKWSNNSPSGLKYLYAKKTKTSTNHFSVKLNLLLFTFYI